MGRKRTRKKRVRNESRYAKADNFLRVVYTHMPQ